MRSAATVLFLFSVLWVHAQSDELIARGQTGGLYLEHVVVAKETWYSVGRMYNVDPKALAVYNHLTFSHSLGIGETLKVPLTAVNFSQDGKKLARESLVPVFHIVQEKEWLYRISVNHNKVPIPVLEKWNQVTGDQVHAGLHLIVGYLKVSTALSALSKLSVPAAGSSSAGFTAADATAKAPAGGRVAKAVMPPASEKAKVVEMADKSDTETVVAAPVSVPVAAPAAAQPPRVSSPAPAAQVSSVSLPAPHFKGGKFKADFTDGGNSVAGQAGIFKSTSGSQDGKYYALINNVAVGTIVKITDQATGKSVYAKVLGQLPEMKESAGLMVRLSNAAAAELGEGEGRFNVGVNY
ncbi:MAG TPA: LysM peptidoglycan-binding domain-containing protein [Puia sp.]|nr:LysM peptidoglycan-binding domain-containing protein [Puia sp.]